MKNRFLKALFIFLLPLLSLQFTTPGKGVHIVGHFIGGTRIYPGRNVSDGGYVQTSMTGVYVDPNTGTPFNYTVIPGDTITIRASDPHRTYFALENLHGTVDNPIVIIPEGGVADVEALSIKNSTNIKVLGDFIAGIKYGFFMDGQASLAPGQTPGCGEAIHIEGRCKNIEIAGVYGYRHCNGVKAKTDPSCADSEVYLNPSSWIMDSITIRDNYFFNIGQEGMYLGHTTPNGLPMTCSGTTTTRYPMRLAHFVVIRNHIDSCNRTGLQLSECDGGLIADNWIGHCGFEWNQFQGAGIILGGHTRNVMVTRDTVVCTLLPGIENLGIGNNANRNYIRKNKVDSTGWLQAALFVNIDSLTRAIDTIIAYGADKVPFTGDGENDDWVPKPSANANHYTRHVGRYVVNVFAQPGRISTQPDYDLLHEFGVDSSTSTIDSNKIGEGVTIDANYNVLLNQNSNAIVFINNNKNPYGYFNYVCNNTLLDGTTAANISAPFNVHYFNTCGTTVSFPNVDAGPNRAVYRPKTSASLLGSGSGGSGGLTYLWTKIAGPTTYTIVSPTAFSTMVTGLTKNGTYYFRLTVTDSNGHSSHDDVRVIVRSRGSL